MPKFFFIVIDFYLVQTDIFTIFMYHAYPLLDVFISIFISLIYYVMNIQYISSFLVLLHWHWGLCHSVKQPWKNRSSWPKSQIPEWTCSISHNATFRTEMCAFLFWMVHRGIWHRCIPGFVRLFYSLRTDNVATTKLKSETTILTL